MATRDTTELQATLEKTVNFAGRIKQDYETIKAAYESVRGSRGRLSIFFCWIFFAFVISPRTEPLIRIHHGLPF